LQILSNSFLSKYKDFPDHMNELGKFVYYRTYSRYLHKEKRRETWKETVRRATEYNIKLAIKHYERIGFTPPVKALRKEAEEYFDNMFNLRQFLSGRTLWVGTPDEKGVSWRYPLANFNCSFTNIEKWDDLTELFYLLLVGAGVGFKCTKSMAEQLPPIRNDVQVIHHPYHPVPKNQRKETTEVREVVDRYGLKGVTIIVGDSKEGWVEALRMFFEVLTKPEYEHAKTIWINYDSVRPKGERLMTFGGYSSGHEPLRDMFSNIMKVLRGELDPYLDPWEVVDREKGYVKVRPIAILDIGNLIGHNVFVGGVRRTAEIFLFSPDDFESMFAKYGLNGLCGFEAFERHEHIKQLLEAQGYPIPRWFDDLGKKWYSVRGSEGTTKYFEDAFSARQYQLQNGGTIDFPVNPGRPLHHRRMSNNSVLFEEKPSRELLHLIFSMLQMEGEPGFINKEELERRRPNVQGLNPCAEIALDSKGVCNLTTVNLVQFVQPDGVGGYELDILSLYEAQALSARAGLRMTLADLELPNWDRVQKRDRLLGCSLTGVKDAFAMLNYSERQQRDLLLDLQDIARRAADEYAKELRIASPLLVTTVKPEGTISQVCGGVSSGLHWSHSPYYIRRIRISAHDPLAQAVKAMGWKVSPEVGTPGETFEEKLKNAQTLVIDFPVASGANRTKDDVSCREQFRTYFDFQAYYTEHNSSNTIHVRPHEWVEAEEIVWRSWNNFAAVSFLAYDGGTYDLAPYEAIDQATYEKLVSEMAPFDPEVLQQFETGTGDDFDQVESDCEGGVCPIR
jgi:ribonucleoside-triphosphate reductase (thioredoxin)